MLPSGEGAAPDSKRGRRAATVGAALGLIAAAGLGLIRFFNADGPEVVGQLVSHFAFPLAYMSPYLLTLIAARVQNAGVRGGLLLAVGVLSLAASFSSFSLVTVLLLPATFVIWFAAVRSLTAADRKLATGAPAALAGLLIAAIIGFGFFALFGVQDAQPRCWVLVHDTDGGSRWESTPNVGGPMSLSPGPMTGSSQGHCTSDVVTNTEAAMSTGALVFALLVALGATRLLPRSGR